MDMPSAASVVSSLFIPAQMSNRSNLVQCSIGKNDWVKKADYKKLYLLKFAFFLFFKKKKIDNEESDL